MAHAGMNNAQKVEVTANYETKKNNGGTSYG